MKNSFVLICFLVVVSSFAIFSKDASAKPLNMLATLYIDCSGGDLTDEDCMIIEPKRKESGSVIEKKSPEPSILTKPEIGEIPIPIWAAIITAGGSILSAVINVTFRS